MRQLAERIREIGIALGFDRVGFAPAAPGPRHAFLHEWLARGFGGEMDYLARRADERVDPRRVLPGARSAIAVSLVYDGKRAADEPLLGHGRVARYAGGDDYHELMRERLGALCAGIEALIGAPFAHYATVDSGPVLERELAARAGLGWIGKNTCVIDPALGSYFFLGVVLSELELPADGEEPDHCGSCRACLDACPTNAFPEPYVMDASRCLSYTTIELRGAIPEPLRAAQRDWLFGCDICQEVCPWNRRSRRELGPDREGLRARLAPRGAWREPALAWVLELDDDAWREATRDTALRRAKRRGLLRNALVAAGNSGDASLVPAIRRHAEGGDPLLAEHARWALTQLSGAELARGEPRRGGDTARTEEPFFVGEQLQPSEERK